MALDADLAKIEAQALAARSVADFLAIIEAVRGIDDESRAALLDLIRRAAAARGVGGAIRAAIIDASRAAAITTAATLEVAATGLASEAAARAFAARRGEELEVRLREGVARALRLERAGAPLDVVRSPLLAAGNSVRAVLSTEVTQVAAAMVTSIADEAGVATVWVAERNACVRCLAYSGVVAEVGEPFPKGLTYGRPATAPREPVAFPPLHPHCRCIVEPLGSQEYADALRREADRSVLRGFSLESESMATRVEAAQRLLERGVDAPASVIAYAERSVAAGRFATRDRPRR